MSTKTLGPIGTVNGHIPSVARTGAGTLFHFDGTTLGLTRAAVTRGVAVGEAVTAWFGTTMPSPRDPGRTMIMEASGGGERTPGGVWMERPRCNAPATMRPVCEAALGENGACLYPSNHKAV